MLTLRGHRSRELFDPWEHLGAKRRRLLELSWAGVFREYLLEHLPVKELAAGFRDGHGRPSKDLSVALGALILQQLHDLTDQQTTEAVALNIAWHYSLDIRHEPDAYLCERTLRNYRTRLLEVGLNDMLFRTLTGEEFRDRYCWRAGVEATMSRFKHQMGMAQLRVRGMKIVTFTAMLRALGLNIHRVATWRKAVAVN